MRAIGALDGYHAALLPRLARAAAFSEMDPSVTLNFLQHGRSRSEVSSVAPRKQNERGTKTIRFYQEEREDGVEKEEEDGQTVYGRE